MGDGAAPTSPTSTVHLVREGGAGPHLVDVGPLSPNTSGQMSRRLTALIRQGLCSINPPGTARQSSAGAKIRNPGTHGSGLAPISSWVTPEMIQDLHPSPEAPDAFGGGLEYNSTVVKC